MIVNPQKSNIVHFRPPSVVKNTLAFTCGAHSLQNATQYTYLGIPFDEHLDFLKTVKSEAQSAGRALGLLIATSKSIGGMPYNVFTKLYDSMVRPVISHGASIWGTKSYSRINAVQNRTMRFCLGLGKYTPTAALYMYGELAWQPPHVKQSASVARPRYHRRSRDRQNYKVYAYCYSRSSTRCKNWQFNFVEHLNLINYHIY
jgi:hypothetical protein